MKVRCHYTECDYKNKNYQITIGKDKYTCDSNKGLRTITLKSGYKGTITC